MSADIRRLQEENIQIREEVKSLKTDPDYIEAYAREKLGLAKEGEIIYRFEEGVSSKSKMKRSMESTMNRSFCPLLGWVKCKDT